LSALHVPPGAFNAQLVPSQKPPETQSASVAQVVLHALASQAYGVQLVVTAAAQVPEPVQLAAAVAIPSLQLALLQAVELDG
jgi:hypothetical protein